MMIMTKMSTLFDDDIVPCPRSVGSDRSCIYSYILDLLTCQRCIAINLSQNTKYTTANTKYTQQIQKNMLSNDQSKTFDTKNIFLISSFARGGSQSKFLKIPNTKQQILNTHHKYKETCPQMSNPQTLIPKTFASVPHITIHNQKSYSSQNPHYKS